jgi:two-component system nitrogen regulation sensor histidine kinase NtrY
MTELEETTSPEGRKRLRERRVALAIGVVFVLTTVLIAFQKKEYGLFQSLLFFGLLNLNVILIMFLVFLVSRNLSRAWLARKTGKLGSSFRWKMVTSLLGFSLVPSVLLFAGSTYVIRQGFDRWFGTQVETALRSSQGIIQVHYDGIERNLGFFSNQIGQALKARGRAPTAEVLAQLARDYPVEGIEIYSDLASPPLRALAEGVPEWNVPRAAAESLQRAMAGESFQLIRQFGDGDLVQQYAVVRVRAAARGPVLDGYPSETVFVLVLSQTVPLGLKTRIAELRSALADYTKLQVFKEPLKSNYTLILLTLFVLVLFVVSWFGLYLARGVTDPVAELLRGTEAFREGRWNYRIPTASSGGGASPDLDVLKGAFNLMAEEVGRRGRQLEEANAQLTSLVHELEERERYLEILLSAIRRGVVVVDPSGRIQRANIEALQFAGEEFRGREFLPTVLGRPWREVFPGLGADDDARLWLAEAEAAKGQPVDRLFEVVVGEGRGSAFSSVRGTGIHLRDERSHSLGWLVILEDVGDAARLERLAAWQEVARRVAHEIKNPLTPLQLNVDILNRRLAPRLAGDENAEPVFRECVGQIQKQIRVIRDLVREFSQFAKLPEPQFRNLDFKVLLEDILDDYRGHYRCKFVVEAPEGVSFQVRGDPEYLRRLAVNLVDNSLHSMEEAKTADPRFQVSFGPSAEEGFIQVSFEDNGPGIPPALREKIFDPYVTSKASGLGLGLAIVRRIASEHRGRIRTEDAVGARFVLELPSLPV